MGGFSFKEFFNTLYLSIKKSALFEKQNRKYLYFILITVFVLLVNIIMITHYDLVAKDEAAQALLNAQKNSKLPDDTFISKIVDTKIGDFSDPISTSYSWQYFVTTSGGYKQTLMDTTVAKSVYVENIKMSNWQEILVKKIYDEGYSDDILNGGYDNLSFSNGTFYVKIDKESENSIIIYFGVIPKRS